MARRSGRSGSDHSRHGRDGRDAYEDGYDHYDSYGERDAYDDEDGARTGYTGAYDDYDSRMSQALVPLDESARLPVAADDDAAGDRTGPVVIPGTGQSMGTGYLPRRDRPLLMRLAVIGLTACVVVTGLFAVVPLGGCSSGVAGATPF